MLASKLFYFINKSVANSNFLLDVETGTKDGNK